MCRWLDKSPDPAVTCTKTQVYNFWKEMAAFAHLLMICAFILWAHKVEPNQDVLESADASFCHGGLRVVYDELKINKCLIIPKSQRQMISTRKTPPTIYFSGAQREKKYVLLMVDPDAPSRDVPVLAYWRHWVISDIQFRRCSLKKGNLQGTTLDEYYPPGPPPNTCFHRYQFMLYEQPANTKLYLTDKEKLSRGQWDYQAFVARFNLGKPVACLQYLTQHFED